MPRQQNAVMQWAPVALTVIAGAWTVFHLIWGLTDHTADDYWGQALLVLFALSLIVAFVRYFQQRPALAQASSAAEPFPEPPITKFFLGTTGAAELWFMLRMNVGAQWLLAGWEKVRDPVWGTSGTALKGFVAGALAKTAGPHPSVQGWYGNFLQQVVQPNAGLFSFLVTWGEVAVGLGLLVGALTGIAAGFGVLMNMNYLLAGTVSINPVLGMFGLFLAVAWRVAGQIGLDRVLLPAIGLPWQPGTLFQQQSTPAAKGG
jgi:thiosulfate dehydrogenase (quinone) large subunit